MKKFVTAGVILLFFLSGAGQDIPPSAEQQLENLADMDQAETEDDAYLLQLEQYRKDPVNLNSADLSELRELAVLTDLQIASLLSYRHLLGKFISIYELQAIPYWDIATIKKLIPFITVGTAVLTAEERSRMLKKGHHNFMVRFSRTLEKQKGFDRAATGTRYQGSPYRIFLRYRYNYKNVLQYGLTGDKDAGEQFFKGAQAKGFDFYSFHVFARKIGAIQAVALGDFTVNMGQGLIQWQSLAFKKSSEISAVKRQSATLRPYNSAGEFNFCRGTGVTFQKKNMQLTVFGSFRRLSANYGEDTATKDRYVTSILASGNHRTEQELNNRNSLRQFSFGGNVKYTGKGWQVAFNGISYRFSAPVQKRPDPYNLFAISGRNWHNISVDYSYTYRNLHLFGEAAADRNFNNGFLNGLLISLDPRADMAVVYRKIAKDYQAVNANAFTESSVPSNESGVYTGITLRPAGGWKMDMYGDLYFFPWLKYQVDAPSRGKDFLIQVTYTPSRQAEFYTRFRYEKKQSNDHAATTPATHYLEPVIKRNWRLHCNLKLDPAIILRNRVELVWYNKAEQTKETGFLWFVDLLYKPMLKPFSGIVRWQYFETDGYNSRVYAYENDVLYSYSIPVSFDKGFRYYFTVNYDVNRNTSFWFRWARTIYAAKRTIGSGLDEIQGNTKTEIKLQARFLF